MNSTTEVTTEVFWTAFRALPKKARNAIVEKMIFLIKKLSKI